MSRIAITVETELGIIKVVEGDDDQIGSDTLEGTQERLRRAVAQVEAALAIKLAVKSEPMTKTEPKSGTDPDYGRSGGMTFPMWGPHDCIPHGPRPVDYFPPSLDPRRRPSCG